MGRSLEIDDPLAAAIAPPLNETPEQRNLREQREVEAKRLNDEIDEMLRGEKVAVRRRKKAVKVLLLGQSESGTQIVLQ